MTRVVLHLYELAAYLDLRRQRRRGPGLSYTPGMADLEPVDDGSLRLAGVLLHPTSLPGTWPGGDFGPEVDVFLDWVEEAGFGLWQVLPLGPSSAGNSPYSSLSSFALDPYLISPERLAAAGLLDDSEVEQAATASVGGRNGDERGRCDFEAVHRHKAPLLRAAWRRFRSLPPKGVSRAFDAFRTHPDRRTWLEDWCLFAALRAHYQGTGWWTWDRSLAHREPGALATARTDLADAVEYEAFLQFCAYEQWNMVRAAASGRGIQILGDLPIYLAHDSAEVWAHRDLFELDESGQPLAVAGVPPDYYCEDGQLWGNPLFRWQRLAEEDYRFWVQRVRGQMGLFDLIRLDHFRAFADYWRVPSCAETARDGMWEVGPGRALFDALGDNLGTPLPLIAEDLGVVGEEVHELRRAVSLPSMRVLQFGFDVPETIHAPHHLEADAFVYTGTHDNDTLVGWLGGLSDDVRARLADYTGGRAETLHRDLVRTALTSVARGAVVPMQDVLGLGSEARMNMPGTATGNWTWRLETLPNGDEAAWLRRLAELSDRLPKAR
ncbi:MAG: 4-alpha-glucanotransferase [Thermoanaerobaculia bacterium]|nr:4-alpha-glucanotransferase [Thermoanaerobaculia bacterium]